MIIENSVYQYQQVNDTIFERVLWVDHSQNSVIVVRLSEKGGEYFLPVYRELKEFEISISAEAVKRTIDPFERTIDHCSSFYKKHVKKRDVRWARIKEIAEDKPDIYDPRLRGVIIRELAEKTKVSTKTYYDSLKQYWKGGQTIDALFPLYENSGAKGKSRIITEEMKIEAEEKGEKVTKRGRKSERNIGVNVDEQILKIIKKAVKEHYQTTDESTLPETYQYMLNTYFNVGFELKEGVSVPKVDPKGQFPTFETFKYHVYKDQDLRDTIIKRKGQNRFNLSSRPVLKSSKNDQMGPGTVFQIDATQSNVYVVNRYDRERILKKPTIYMVQDVFTHLITGEYVSINAPRWLGVQMALFDAFTNSKIYSSLVGNGDDNSDTCMVPKVLLPDNGSEFISLNSDFLSSSTLNIRISNAAPYRADWKGLLEKFFDKVKKKLRKLPGSVKKGYKERGEADHRMEAILDLDQLRSIVQIIVKKHNFEKRMEGYKKDELMTIDGVLPIPIELWKWGIKNRGTDLKEKSMKDVLVNLLPRAEATVQREGIFYKNRSYSCDLADEEQWYEKSAAYGRWKVPIAYDPRNAGILYLVLENGKRLERCHLLSRDQRYNNYTTDEIEDLLLKEQYEKHEYEIEQYQSEAEEDALIDAVVAKSLEKIKPPLLPVSNNKKVKDINGNTQKVRREEDLEEARNLKRFLDEKKSNSFVDDNEKMEEKLEKLLSKDQSLHKILENY